MNVLDHVRARAAAHPDAACLQDRRGAWSASRLWSRVCALADQLNGVGARRLTSTLDNGAEAVALDLATRLAGIVHIPLPGFFSAGQLQHVQADAGADLHASPGAEAELRLQPLHPVAVPALPAATALVTYTSGSTGTPKGVCLSVAHLDQVCSAIVDGFAGRAPQRHLCVLPLSVLLEQVAGVHAALLADAEVLLPSLAQTGLAGAAQLDARQFARCIDRHRPESLILVPQMLQAWLAALSAGERAPDSLRFAAVGGARVGGRLLDAAQRLRLPVFEGYGLSECGSVVCLNRPGATRAGSVGRSLGHLRVEVDREGEILVHGPRFLGYLGAPECAPGPWRTGDLGALDADGYLSISGRRRNVFITAFGRNVSPEWVESELAQHPLIAQAVVHGEARAWNAAVVVPGRADLSSAALAAAIDEVNQGLPDYARVARHVRALEPFTPANRQLTDNGRVRREVVLAHYGAAIESLYSNED